MKILFESYLKKINILLVELVKKWTNLCMHFYEHHLSIDLIGYIEKNCYTFYKKKTQSYGFVVTYIDYHHVNDMLLMKHFLNHCGLNLKPGVIS